MASEWWEGLPDHVRGALIAALYTAAQGEKPNDGEAERLRGILERGEGRWEEMYRSAQEAFALEGRERAAANRELREENAKLREEVRALRGEEANVKRRANGYEARMEDQVRRAFPDAVYENRASTPGAGDAELLAPLYTLHRCMLEYKAHAKAVRDADVAKLARDLDGGTAAFAMMLTRSANVCGRRDFDVEFTPLGKPILFVVRTDDCGAALGSVLKLALRYLARLTDAGEDGERGGSEPAQMVQAFGRVHRRMRTRLTQFQRQCEALQDGMASGLAELHTLVAPLRAPRTSEGRSRHLKVTVS